MDHRLTITILQNRHKEFLKELILVQVQEFKILHLLHIQHKIFQIKPLHYLIIVEILAHLALFVVNSNQNQLSKQNDYYQK